MIIPDKNVHGDNSKKFNGTFNKDQSNNDKKGYYEIGCKIFEVNKFYKNDM
jgi:hypothetical protein